MKHKKVQFLVVCIVLLLGNSRKVFSFSGERKNIDACLESFKEWKVRKIKSINVQIKLIIFNCKRINFA